MYHKIVTTYNTKVIPTFFTQWITIKPCMPYRCVETVAIVVEFCFVLIVLRREAVTEEVGERTGLRNRTPEIVVFVGGDNDTGFVNVLCYVAVVVKSWEIELAAARNGQESTHAARALEGTRKIESPEKLHLGYVSSAAVDYRNRLVYQVPVVVYEHLW